MGVNEFNVDRSATGHKAPPCSGVWGTQRVEISGDARTDSYDADSNAYMPGLAGTDGDVCSNGSIEVIGSAEINGDASPGPGYRVELTGSGTVSGASTPGDIVMPFPSVDASAAAADNDNKRIGPTDFGQPAFRKGSSTDLYVAGGADNVTLTSGTYYFTSIEIKSQGTITIDGDVTIYVTGDVRMNGGSIINESLDPGDLTIYSTGANFELHGGTGFYGTLYAPQTDVYMIGSSSYYGQIVGKTVDIGGMAEIHVDESLDLFTRPEGSPTLVQ